MSADKTAASRPVTEPIKSGRLSLSKPVTTADPATVKRYLLDLQQTIVQTLTARDPKSRLREDDCREPTRDSRVRVLEHGDVFEKGAINFSHIEGERLPHAATLQRPELAGQAFQAMGVSLILHPDNPFVPTTHFNLRFFTAGTQWWFGGGYDLTPYYGFEEDCRHWHRTAKAACDPFGTDIYPRFKKQCDDYFFIAHRNEPRGIGGLFFDDFNTPDLTHCFGLARAIGDSLLPAYLPIVEKRKNRPFNQRHKAFQHRRRGRYVEFNLIYDRGTLFGLQYARQQTNPGIALNIESILCSLPPAAGWHYRDRPERGAEEAALYEKFLKPRDWAR